jgi:hypothetical protein
VGHQARLKQTAWSLSTFANFNCHAKKRKKLHITHQGIGFVPPNFIQGLPRLMREAKVSGNG